MEPLEKESDDETSPLINKFSAKNKNLSFTRIDPKQLKTQQRQLEDISGSTQQRTPYVAPDNTSANGDHDSVKDHSRNVAQYKRYQYYAKLHSQSMTKLVIPNHILPRELFWPYVGKTGSKQSSVVTIFAIWNTMMGTSLLSLPWALQQSGFALGIGIIMIMGIICLYTCLVIVKSGKELADKPNVEFIDICEKYLGKGGKVFALVFGLAAFVGAVMVYWVLMSNFLYKIGVFIYDDRTSLPATNITSHNFAAVLCPSQQSHLNDTVPHPLEPSGVFYQYWNKRSRVPLYLVAVLFPLCSLKSPTFFTKFNSFGTISLLYVTFFVIYKASSWGVHLHFNSPLSQAPAKLYNMNFPALTGTLALALYIHNAILSILSMNKKPENNARDVSIAYLLTAGMYFMVAVVFYMCFPIDKSCIEQVFLDNFPSTDIMVFVAQCGLFFQMCTVFPLLMYIIRVQVFMFLFDRIDLGYIYIMGINAILISIGVCMAVFYPMVGHIIRYVGSLSGLVYIFTLPSLVHMCIMKKHGALNWYKVLFYSVLISLGVLNLVAQFLVKE